MISLCLVLALAPQDLLVCGYNSDTVHRFDAATLAAGPALGSVPGAQSARYGPDGDLYVVAEKTAQVLRFDGQSGAFVGVFVGDDPLTPEDESGGLNAPTAAVFGPDGLLYVGDFADDDVLRFDGQTGAFVDTFIAAGTASTNGIDAGLVFGPEGDLWVPAFNSNLVSRFDGQSGALLAVEIGPSDGLARPRALRFRDDGSLFVTSWGNNRILRLPPAGGPPEVFATTFRPTGFDFDPATGDLLVTNDQDDAVRRLDGATGAVLGIEIPGATSPVDGGTWVAFLPDPRLRLARLDPGQAGGANTLELRNATPNGALFLALGLAPASIPLAACPNAWLAIDAPALIPLAADGAGELSLSAFLDAALSGLTLRLQAFDVATCRTSQPVVQTL